jgi:hypothetical protein
MRVILQRGKRADMPRAHTGPFSTGSRRKTQRFVLFWTPYLDPTCSLFFSYRSGKRGPMVDYRLYRQFHRSSPCALSVATQHLTFVCGVIAQASSIFIRPMNFGPNYLIFVQIEIHFPIFNRRAQIWVRRYWILLYVELQEMGDSILTQDRASAPLSKIWHNTGYHPIASPRPWHHHSQTTAVALELIPLSSRQFRAALPETARCILTTHKESQTTLQ